MNVAPATLEPTRIPATPELIARAVALVHKYDAKCFWFWHPEARIECLEDIELVIRQLRDYGNHEAWKDA